MTKKVRFSQTCLKNIKTSTTIWIILRMIKIIIIITTSKWRLWCHCKLLLITPPSPHHLRRWHCTASCCHYNNNNNNTNNNNNKIIKLRVFCHRQATMVQLVTSCTRLMLFVIRPQRPNRCKVKYPPLNRPQYHENVELHKSVRIAAALSLTPELVVSTTIITIIVITIKTI